MTTTAIAATYRKAALRDKGLRQSKLAPGPISSRRSSSICLAILTVLIDAPAKFAA
jgi:hypothetical protein